ncbi:GIMA4 GTPase, partial [Polypterus senegalus]|nr:GIMA4 GTPase [Polypterus senegalus]
MSKEHGKRQRSNKVLQDGEDDVEKTDQVKNTEDEQIIISELIERNGILTQRNKNLKSTNEKLENEISKMKRKEAECLKKNNELEMRIKELERDKRDLERKIKELQKENENLKKKMMINEESQVMTASDDSGVDDWEIVEKSEIDQEENIHLQKKSEINQKEERFIDKKSDNEGFAHLKIVLVGRCGIGKSTLFNSVVVKEEFTTDPGKQSATEHCEIFHGVRGGWHITVIDTPGFFSSHLSNEQVSDKIQTDIKMAPPGPFLFLLMVEVDNFTQEDSETANIIEKMLDGNKGNMMVVFTQGCRLKSTIEEYVQRSDENLQKLLKKCEQRCLVLNNTAMNLQHLKELCKINDQLVQKDRFGKDGDVEEIERVSKRKSSLDIVPPATPLSRKTSLGMLRPLPSTSLDMPKVVRRPVRPRSRPYPVGLKGLPRPPVR